MSIRRSVTSTQNRIHQVEMVCCIPVSNNNNTQKAALAKLQRTHMSGWSHSCGCVVKGTFSKNHVTTSQFDVILSGRNLQVGAQFPIVVVTGFEVVQMLLYSVCIHVQYGSHGT